MDPAAYHVDLSEVDHVDIVKGPFDVTTPGALGGFVKIVDKTPNVNGIKVTTNVSTGSYGYYNPSLVMQAGTRALHFLAGYSYRTSEMYRDASGQKVSALAAYRDGNENLQAFRTQSGWMKSAFQPSANQQFEIAYTRQQGGEVLYPYMMMDGIFDNADRFTARYDYFKPHPFLRSIHGLVYVNKVNHLMDNRLRSSAGTLPYSMSTHVVSFTTGGRVDADLTQDLTVGFESYRRYWNSNGMMIMNSMGMGGMGGNMITSTNTLPGVTEFVNGTYATLRKTLGGRFLFTSGARFDHSSTDASEANPALYQAYHGTAETRATDSGFSGNARLSWQASSWASVFAGVGSNIRFPDPEERFFRSDSSMSHGWVGNPLLRHPRDTEFDLGLTAKQRHYSLRPLIFFSKLDNYVALYSAGLQQAVTGVMSTTAQTYANVQAHQWGGELTGRVPLSSFLSLYGGLAYTRGTKVPQPANNIYSSNLFQVPPLRSELNLRYEQKRVYTEVSGIVTGRQDHVDTDEHEQVTAGYSVFNFRFGYRTARFHAEGGLNNVLNRGYTEFLSYARNPYNNGLRLPEPGRNFFVNLAWTLGRSSE
jgi:iron complex outermembrane receptor protein